MRDLAEKAQRKIGMQEGEDNMKKLMILAAVAAMATGAWAYDYQFNYSIANIPQEYQKLSSLARFEILVNDSVVAYVSMSEFGTTFWDADGWKKLEVGGEKYGTGTSLKNIDNHNGTKNVQFELHIDMENELLAKYQYNTIKKSGGIVESSDNLKMRLYDPGDDSHTSYESVATPNTGYGIGFTANEGKTVFTATYTYAVPEPTSAMLLLLGFAGLALKRKQVA